MPDSIRLFETETRTGNPSGTAGDSGAFHGTWGQRLDRFRPSPYISVLPATIRATKRPALVTSNRRIDRALPRLVFFLAVVGIPLLGGCASRTVDDFSPEIPLDPAGQPLPVIVELTDYRMQPATVFILTNHGGTERLRRSYRGKLPVHQKQVSDEDRMGQLLAYMRDHGFFEYARPAGQPPAVLPSGARRTLSVWIGDRPMVRMIDVRGMGTAGRQDEVQAMTHLSRAIQDVSNTTLSLKIDLRGPRNAEDFLNQPALRRPAKAR